MATERHFMIPRKKIFRIKKRKKKKEKKENLRMKRWTSK